MSTFKLATLTSNELTLAVLLMNNHDITYNAYIYKLEYDFINQFPVHIFNPTFQNNDLNP